MKSLPKRLSLTRFTERTLAADVVDLASGRRRVRVSVAGDVADIEGYLPLPADLRAEIRGFADGFDTDLPLADLEAAVADLEAAVADRLRSAHDLAEVSIRLDERGRATVAAAPPLAGVSKRVPAGIRAVSVRALLPTGLARGDVVTVVTDDDRNPVDGTVAAARTDRRAR